MINKKRVLLSIILCCLIFVSCTAEVIEVEKKNNTEIKISDATDVVKPIPLDTSQDESFLLPEEPPAMLKMCDWVPGEKSKQEVISLLDELLSGTEFVRYLIKTPEEISQMSATQKYWIFNALIYEEKINHVDSFPSDELLTESSLSDKLTQNEITYLNNHGYDKGNLYIYSLDEVEYILGKYFGEHRVLYRQGIYPNRDEYWYATAYITENRDVIHYPGTWYPSYNHTVIYEICGYREEGQIFILSVYLVTYEQKTSDEYGGDDYNLYSAVYDFAQQKILAILPNELSTGNSLSIKMLLKKAGLSYNDLCVADLAFYQSEDGIRFLGMVDKKIPESRFNIELPEVTIQEANREMINLDNDEGIPIFSRPTEGSEVIMIIPKEEFFTEKGYNNNKQEWLYIDFRGQEGWINTEKYGVHILDLF